ncbi:hypothetical protein SAMN05518866_1694 [Sphingobium sp. YR768]|nr:hypothetical protein SAMN05518866_1694 [Sphingobium sp. YR768]
MALEGFAARLFIICFQICVFIKPLDKVSHNGVIFIVKFVLREQRKRGAEAALRGSGMKG